MACMASAVCALACGPFEERDYQPLFFHVSSDGLPCWARMQKEENLLLWQAYASGQIPVKEIEAVVYGNAYNDIIFSGKAKGQKAPANRFLAWMLADGTGQPLEFIRTAKEVEKKRKEQTSPWYYPESKVDREPGTDAAFEQLKKKCLSAKGTALHDRYGLQLVRCFFASGQYAKCDSVFSDWFAGIPDDNLMKRMANSYAAGCWARLGDRDRANRWFAARGEIASITGEDALQYMVKMNPSDPELMRYIQNKINNIYWDGRTGFIADKLLPLAYRVLDMADLKNRGDWEFLVAVIEGECNGDFSKARKLIRLALSHGLTTSEGANHARAYRMLVDGHFGDSTHLLDDLLWLETLMGDMDADGSHWDDRLRYVVYRHWFPALEAKGDKCLAMLLGNYTDHVYRYMTSTAKAIKTVRMSETDLNEYDYGSSSFEYMNEQTSDDLIAYKAYLGSASPLVAHLRDIGRNDDDFISEAIGTVSMRERNYARAAEWLRKVSDRYERTLNVYKLGYLKRDPFDFRTLELLDSCDELAARTLGKDVAMLADTVHVKLNYAGRMLELEREMNGDPDPDKRAIAKIKYAWAFGNSAGRCWALTAYRKGYYDDDLCRSFIPYIVERSYEYYDRLEHDADSIKRSMIDEALTQLVSDEAKAEAHYMLGNLKTIACRYASTETARKVRSRCDNWKDWLTDGTGRSQ